MKRVAIIGAGSSGLVTLKTALEHLKGYEIVCFEKSNSIRGCWGNPYKGFVSTSTKYTTQFACYKKYDATVDEGKNYKEFFRDQEYGDYLESFADTFKLHQHIQLETEVVTISKSGERWQLKTKSFDAQIEQMFDHVVLCTGLVEAAKELNTSVSRVSSSQELESIREQTVVVVGGGESAADIANRLAAEDRKNKVYLSLKQGIRVSPRYHPIKGVPSDYLRNRLMLSINQRWRNAIGEQFVKFRILYKEKLEKLFPSKNQPNESGLALKKQWDYKLTKAAKDNLFNVFHNKSDGFLDAVGEGRIQIIGEAVDDGYKDYYEFQSSQKVSVETDIVVPMIGFKSIVSQFFEEKIKVSDFYLGCVHREYENLFLIGFARPIIGNIPTISEQQALFVMKTISEEVDRPLDIMEKHHQERKQLEQSYPTLNTAALYPVEMFPYCDHLAKLAGTFPTRKKVASLRAWLRIQLTPATTLDYSPGTYSKQKIYTPLVLLLLLAVIRFFDVLFSRSEK